MFRVRIGKGKDPMTLINPSPTATEEMNVPSERHISKEQLDEMFSARVGNGNIPMTIMNPSSTEEMNVPSQRLISKEQLETEANFEDNDFNYSEEMLQRMGKKKKREVEKLLRKREKDIMKLKKLQHKRALLYLKIEDKEHKAQEKKMWEEYHSEVMADVKSAKKQKKIKAKELKKAEKERRETRLHITIRCPKVILSCFPCFSHYG